jgi:hypothetical protein
VTNKKLVFNAPPNWPTPQTDWTPPEGWTPNPTWGESPKQWRYWSYTDGSQAPDEIAYSFKPPTQHSSPTDPTDQESSLIDFDDERVLQSLGIYQYHHPLEDSAAYQTELKELQKNIRDYVTSGHAIIANDQFSLNGSITQGRKLTKDLSRLMLRAYNAEADSCVRALRNGNAETAIRRLEASVKSIERFGSLMELKIEPTYHKLRIQEIQLVADFQMKKREEREAAQLERARLREERLAAQELEEELERLRKEQSHYLNVLHQLTKDGRLEEATDIAAKVAEIEKAIEFNDFRLTNIRTGYVYVISNPGSFGKSVLKIGLTRRLDPTERIRELSGASVPFPFEVHALFFSNDAVTLENELHHEFDSHRVNAVNRRREFFFVEPEVVKKALLRRIGSLLEFHDKAESLEYYQSLRTWQAQGRDNVNALQQHEK